MTGSSIEAMAPRAARIAASRWFKADVRAWSRTSAESRAHFRVLEAATERASARACSHRGVASVATSIFTILSSMPLMGLMGLMSSPASAADSPFASSVVSYVAGSGAASGFTNPTVALGSPERFSGEGLLPQCVTPFQPAFRPNCLPKSKLFRFWKEGNRGEFDVQKLPVDFFNPILYAASSAVHVISYRRSSSRHQVSSSSNPSPAHPAPAVEQSKGVSDQLRRLLRLLAWRHCGKHSLWRARHSRHWHWHWHYRQQQTVARGPTGVVTPRPSASATTRVTRRIERAMVPGRELGRMPVPRRAADASAGGRDAARRAAHRAPRPAA
jgi:hypothetical protein